MAVGVNIVSTFDSKGIARAIKDFKALDGAGNKASFGLRTLDKGLSNTLASVGKVAAGVAIAAGAIGYKLATAAYDAQKVMAQTEAIIEATGGAAGVTAKQVSDLSSKLSMQIGVDDELIQSSANLLLTFKQVKNQVGVNNNIFDQAVIAAQDLGNVFGSSEAAAMQLGKALSDPEKGITALRRAGINFTEAQKEQIKTLVQSGDVLGAQKLILAEVESQVGGTAAATATGFDRMRVAVENVAEKFGTLLLPYIEKFANFVTNTVVPYLNNLSEVIGEQGLGGGIKLLADDFLKLTTNMGTFGNVLLGLTTAFITFKAIAIAAAIAQNLFNVALFANPIGIIVASVIAFVVVLAALYLKFESVRKVVNMLGEVLKFVVMNAIAGVYNYFVTFINVAITGINLLIKAANLFGADINEIGKLGYMAFTGIGNAAKQAKADISGVAERTGAMAAKEGGVQKVVKALKDVSTAAGGGGGAAKAVETAGEKLQKFIDKLQGVTKAQRSLKDATKSVENANNKLTDAFANTAKAQANLNKISKGYALDSKEVVAQSRSVADAQRSLVKANISAGDSVKSLKAAEEALQKLREKVSPFDLESGEVKLQKAKFDVEEANFDVLDAEKELAELRKDPESTPQAIREAEINLAEAKFDVRDAIQSVADSEKELIKLRTDTPTLAEIADAERVVADAKLAVEDANLAVADAQANVNQEQEKLNELVNGAKEGSDAYTEALKELTDAQKAESDAISDRIDAYERLADATRDLAKAEKERRLAEQGLTDKQIANAVANENARIEEGVPPALLGTVLEQIDDAYAGKNAFYGGGSGAAGGVASGLTEFGLSMAEIEANLAAIDWSFGFGLPAGFTPFADGGIVTSPMMGLVGESGSEAIIPLDRLGQFGGQTINITINAGIGTDASAVGDEIVNVLQRYNRRNGALPLKVA